MIPIRDHNPAHRRPIVTIGLIATCVLVFLWQNSLDARAGAQAVYSFGFIPAVLFDTAVLPSELAVLPAEATLITSMFLHGGFMHLAGNMLYLWVFGNNIEDAAGHVRFALFYVLCGLAAAFAQALPNPDSEIPMIGASGAISGVLGAYLVLFPRARVDVLIPFGILFIHTLPAGWLLGFWFVFQLASGVFADPSAGGVAWWAHVGGFIAGMALIFPFRDRQFKSRAQPTIQPKVQPRVSGRSRIPPSTRRPRGPWG